MTPSPSRPRKTKAAARKRPARKGPVNPADEWILRLYVAGQTARTSAALANLSLICEQHLAGRYRLEVIDLLQMPQLARGDQIIAVPTLVRQLPPPVKKIIGDLSSADRVLVGLDLLPRDAVL